MKKILCISLLVLLSSEVFSQSSPDYGSGMKINFNEDGSKHMRTIAWGQVWSQYRCYSSQTVELTLQAMMYL